MSHRMVVRFRSTMWERLRSYRCRARRPCHRCLHKQDVAVPPNECLAGWVAVHVIDFYNDVCIIWAVLKPNPSHMTTSFHKGEGFPPGVVYTWPFAPAGGEPVQVSAPQYVELVLHWIAEELKEFPDDNDEAQNLQVLATKEFAKLCGTILRRLFRIYAIIYNSFFKVVEAREMSKALHTYFKYFMFFCFEFGLLPERELVPMEAVVRPIREAYEASKRQGERHTGSNKPCNHEKGDTLSEYSKRLVKMAQEQTTRL